jgi:poly(3-hydroxybutyrate) depolymerase
MDGAMRTTTPPGIVDASIDTAFSVHEAVVRSATDYGVSLLERHATPFDVLADVFGWAALLAHREPPRWATEHTVDHEWPQARLRNFSDPDGPDMVATLFLPPQAGHDSCIVDFAPTQSQVRSAQASGLTRLYSLDWKGATWQTRGATIDDYMVVVDEAIDRIGGRANLVGDCQGGWLAVIYTALHPSKVHSLTIAGAPVDFHAGEPLIHEWIQLLTPFEELALYRFVVNGGKGVLPGQFLLNGFKALQPEAELDRQLQLLAHIHDRAHVERYRTFENWFQHTQPIPGTFYLWIVQHLFQRNELIKGELEVGGSTVDLGAITCPLNLLAGVSDHITPPPQVYALADHASTPATAVRRYSTSGGHLGIFMGREALNTCWRPLFGDLAAGRSGGEGQVEAVVAR